MRRAHLVVLVAYLAENLLQNICESHQSGHGAKFVHDQRHVRVMRAELVNKLVYRLGFGNHQRLSKKAAQTERRVLHDGDRARTGAHPKRASDLCS